MLTYAALAFALLSPAPEDPTIAETQALLYEVEAEMRAADGEWSSAQLATRLELLDELRAYADAGVFPHNHTHDHEVPVFIDEHGTHCAVAFLILSSGQGDLAEAIAAEHNHIRLPHGDERIAEWASEHGFTTLELSQIQRPGYRPRKPVTGLQAAKQKQIGSVLGVVHKPTPKKRTRLQVAKAMRRHQRALDRCAQKHPRPRATATLFVKSDGRASLLKLPNVTGASRRCVSAIVKMARFPKGQSERVQVRI